MTSHRRGTMRAPLLPILLVLAFLAHDAWMAHAGHIVYAAADDAPAMGERAHAGHHAAALANVPQPETSGLIAQAPGMPLMAMTCETMRTGTLGQPTSVPGPIDSLAVLPVLHDAAARIGQHRPIAWQPPGQPPDVRRAFLQVYRE